MEFLSTFIGLAVTFGVFFVSLSVHEFAHAFASYKLGDPTAKLEGRMTLNPLAHIDPLGTVIVPIFLSISGLPAFGWAKPVHVNLANFQKPPRDNFFTALSGPLANFILAFICAFLLSVFPQSEILGMFVVINVVLAVFNLLPIPPLDGSKIWHLFLSDESYFALERLGPVILITVLFFLSYFDNYLFGLITTITNAIINVFQF